MEVVSRKISLWARPRGPLAESPWTSPAGKSSTASKLMAAKHHLLLLTSSPSVPISQAPQDSSPRACLAGCLRLQVWKAK